MQIQEELLVGAAVATNVTIFAVLVYYAWRLLASFRHKSVSRWPPALCLGLWLMQWPFFVLSAVGCLGGGCDSPIRNWVGLVVTLGYNLVPAYWLWCRPAKTPDA